MNQTMMEYLKQIVPEENILFQEPMSKHTTFRVGGPAEIFINVTEKEQLQKLVGYLSKISQDFFVLGRGSNLLVGDKGYNGIVINAGALSTIEVDGNKIHAYAGASLPMVAKVAAEHSLNGLAFAAGIPGTIGGAIVMNAGAYDGEMKQVVKSVFVVNQEGQEMELDNDAMEFGYRTSIIKNRPFVVTDVILELKEGNQDEIYAQMEDFNQRRKDKQPLEYPSAGSTFKRPEGHFAGKLIMDAGLRGFRIGGAQVSEKHCGFVVNIGNATAADVKEVIEEVSQRVKAQFGIRLEPEVIFLGDF